MFTRKPFDAKRALGPSKKRTTEGVTKSLYYSAGDAGPSRRSSETAELMVALRHVPWQSPNDVAVRKRIARGRRRLAESTAWRAELERRAAAVV